MCTFVFIVLAVIMFIIALTLARSASLEPPKPPGMQDEFRLTWPEIVAELRLRLGKPDHVLDPGGSLFDPKFGPVPAAIRQAYLDLQDLEEIYSADFWDNTISLGLNKDSDVLNAIALYDANGKRLVAEYIDHSAYVPGNSPNSQPEDAITVDIIGFRL